IDPAPAIIGIAHLSPALERLRLELRPRTEIGDHARGIEARPPAPLEVSVNGLRIRAIVVAEELEPDWNGRLPSELRVITRSVGEARTDVEQRMSERGLVARYVVVERRQGLAMES